VCVCLETPLGCHFAFAVCILLVRFLAKFCRQSSLKLNAGARWSQRWLSTVCCLWMTCRVGAFFFIVMNYVFSNMSAVDIFIKERAVFMWAGKLSRHNFAAHSCCQDKPFIGFCRLEHTHYTRTRLTGLPGWAGTRKVRPIWILLKQETVSDSGISWATCKSASRSRQITMPAPHHSVFYRPDALPVTQPTASKHWRFLWQPRKAGWKRHTEVMHRRNDITVSDSVQIE